MKDNKGQYRVLVRERAVRRGRLRGAELENRVIDDPFITTTIRPKGWRAALAVLLGRYEIVVRVDGEPAAYRVVFRGDYSPDDESLPRSVQGVG